MEHKISETLTLSEDDINEFMWLIISNFYVEKQDDESKIGYKMWGNSDSYWLLKKFMVLLIYILAMKRKDCTIWMLMSGLKE